MPKDNQANGGIAEVARLPKNQREDGEEGAADTAGLYSHTAFKSEIVFACADSEISAYPSLY